MPSLRNKESGGVSLSSLLQPYLLFNLQYPFYIFNNFIIPEPQHLNVMPFQKTGPDFVVFPVLFLSMLSPRQAQWQASALY